MNHPAIFSATLGLSHPWQVTAVSVTKEQGRLDITVDYTAGTCVCPHCGAQRPCHPSEIETWMHHDFFSFRTFLHARVPQVESCPCGSDVPVARPWCRAGSRFMLLEREEGMEN